MFFDDNKKKKNSSLNDLPKKFPMNNYSMEKVFFSAVVTILFPNKKKRIK